jgi:hypothetical protein
MKPLTIEDIKRGDRVVWFSPRVEGEVIDVDYRSVQIRWDDGTHSIQPKADGFIGWMLLSAQRAETPVQRETEETESWLPIAS